MVSSNPLVVNRSGFVLAEESVETARSLLEAAKTRVERLRRQRDDIEDAARREGIPPGYYLR